MSNTTIVLEGVHSAIVGFYFLLGFLFAVLLLLIYPAREGHVIPQSRILPQNVIVTSTIAADELISDFTSRKHKEEAKETKETKTSEEGIPSYNDVMSSQEYVPKSC